MQDELIKELRKQNWFLKINFALIIINLIIEIVEMILIVYGQK